VAHLVVEHGEEAKEKIESNDVWKVERNVQTVREQESEPDLFWALTRNSRPFLSPLSFFQVDDAFVGNYTLTNKTNWV